MKKINTVIISFMLAISLFFTGCSKDFDAQTDKAEAANSADSLISESADEASERADISSWEISEEIELTEDEEESEDETADDKIGENVQESQSISQTDLSDIEYDKEYSGSPFCVVNNNIPYFSDAELTASAFEQYSQLDELGRCGVCLASIGRELMPTEKRGDIGMVKPTGWHTVKYDCVDGKYLYNRCHLIGYQLTAENANVNNLITGTRYMNVEGMLPFENMVADYIKETGNHVLYRVTPIFEGDNLLAAGVLMEACSVEDRGEGILFNVFCYNVQPGVEIDYRTGSSAASETSATEEPAALLEAQNTPQAESLQTEQNIGSEYVLNTNTMKFHYPSCTSVKTIKDENRQSFTGDRADLINQGFAACKKCNP